MKIELVSPILGLMLVSLGCSGAAPTPGTAAPAATNPKPEEKRICTAQGRGSDSPNAGWKIVGALAMTIQEGTPVSIEARDASGKVMATTSLKEVKNGRQYEQAVNQATCDAGGVLLGKEHTAVDPKNGITTIDVFAPEKEDEQADLKTMCAPRTFDTNTDESAADFAGISMSLRWLTSYRFRAWHVETKAIFDQSLQSTPPKFEALRPRADELERIAKEAGMTSCSYVEAIRRLK